MQPIAETPSRRRIAVEGLGILLLALTLNLVGNGRTSLWDRDEPRYAQCTREMMQSGDYLLPTYNGEPRHHKPVLIYWLMLIGTSIGGDNPFGARLVSAVAGACTCLIVWGFGGNIVGRRAGLLAALMLATTPLMFADSKLATTDAVLTLFVLICQLALCELNQRESRVAAAIFWIALALSLLTKGPIGIGLIAVSGLCTRLASGQSACWSRLQWRWGFSLFALIAGPWYVAIGVATRGEFFRFAVQTQIVQRISSELEQHGGFPGYYPITLLGTFYPWSALLPAAGLMAWVKRKSCPKFGFLLGWIAGPMLFLELVRTKLVHYYLPSFPACALLVACLIEALTNAEINLRRWPLGRVAIGILAGTGIGITVTLLALAWVLPGPAKWPCLLVSIVLAAGTLMAIEQFQRGLAQRAALGLVATWGVILLAVGGWLLPSLDPYRLSGIVARRLEMLCEIEKADPILAMYKEPSIIYAMRRPIEILVDRPSLIQRIRNKGPVITAFTDRELKFMRQDERFRIDIRDTVRGIDINKNIQETLFLVVMRPAAQVADRRLQRPMRWIDRDVRKSSAVR